MKDLFKNKGWFFTFFILAIAIIVNNIYLIVNIEGLHGIENTLRLTLCIIIVLLTLLNIFLMIKGLIKNKNIINIFLLVITLILGGIILFLNVNFNIIYKKLNKVTANYTTYSISLVTYMDNTVNDIKDIGNDKIGIINDHEIANGYVFGEEILKNEKMSNELVEYESYINILDELINKDINYAFLPSNYIEVFSAIEGYEDIANKLKTILEKSKQEEEKTITTTKNITEPFTMLLMGVDSTNDSIANTSANGDSLLLITFNPTTLKATMVSIPRDSYVPITCMSNRKNKITHSAWGGEKCIINTISQLMDLNIDYYVKINFTGIVKLVDTLDGINVDVEYSFCEQNSKRLWGPYTVFVEKGFQRLDGEQALAYARNRHPYPEFCEKKWTDYNSNDFIRGLHQQEIVKAILTKLKDVRDLDTFYGILDTISDNMETNMDRDTILSFYNVAKDIVIKSQTANSVNELINIQKLYISGKSATIYDYNQYSNSGMRLNLYNFIPSKDSINAIIKAMKINLGMIQKDAILTFSYDANKPYEETVIGEGIYSNANVELLPDFYGQTKQSVENYAKEHNLGTPTFIEEESDLPKGAVIAQDPPAKIDLDNINPNKGLTITISKGKKTSTTTDYSVCKEPNGKDNKLCTLNIANYIGKNYTSLKSLKSIITITEVTVTDGATKENAGTIKSIDGKISGTLDLTKITEIKIEYYVYVNDDDDDDDDDDTGSSSGTGPTTPPETTKPGSSTGESHGDDDDDETNTGSE